MTASHLDSAGDCGFESNPNLELIFVISYHRGPIKDYRTTLGTKHKTLSVIFIELLFMIRSVIQLPPLMLI